MHVHAYGCDKSLVSECMRGVCTSVVVSWFMVRGPLLQKGAFVLPSTCTLSAH